MSENLSKFALAPSAATPPIEKADKRERLSLWILVTLGLGVSLVTVFLLSWYFSQQEWLISCGTLCGSWKFFPPLDQQQMFGVIRNSVTAAAALGLGVTLVLSYRRQKVAEKTLVFTAETQRLAVEAQALAQKRLEREGLDTLRGRYLDIAELLNKETDFARITALHALESLTTSWRQFGIDREANASVGLLLSTARLSKETDSPHTKEFRQTTWRTLDRHMKEDIESSLHWGSLDIDATSCLTEGGIYSWKIAGGDITGSRLDNAYFPIRFVTINTGALRVFGRPISSAPERNHTSSRPLWWISRLTMNGGRFILNATAGVEDKFRVNFSSCALKQGNIAINLGRWHGSSEISFDRCYFELSRISLFAGSNTIVSFTNCEFRGSPIQVTQKLIQNGLIFNGCSTIDSDGQSQKIENVDDYLRYFPHRDKSLSAEQSGEQSRLW